MAPPTTCGCGHCTKCKRREYMRQWYRRPGNAEKQRESQSASRARRIDAVRAYDRERNRRRDIAKVRARKLLNQKIQFGRMERKPCEACGEVVTDAHHEDYERPYDVRWLCRIHHMELHRLAA